MTPIRAFLHTHAKRLIAVAIVVAIGLATRLPRLSSTEQAELSQRFDFVKHDLPYVPGPEMRQVRDVHPQLQKMCSWISSVGAAVSVADLDRDGLANDICYVHTPTDQVIVTPAPVEGRSVGRYEPFVLDAGERFDRTTMCPTGCIASDMNEDGLLDVLVYYWGRAPIAFLQVASGNAGAGELNARRFVAVEITGPDERWFTNAATFADVDGDGHADLIVGNYFEDGARILDEYSDEPQHMHDSMSRAFNGGTNRVLLWKAGRSGDSPHVAYVEAKDALPGEVARGWTLALGAADLDGDLLPELYCSNDFGPDRLLHNRSRPGRVAFAVLAGRKGLFTPHSKALGRDSFKGMGCDFGDLNGDGWLDIYVSNIAAEFALEESHFTWVSTGEPHAMAEGVAPYVDRSEQLGLSRSGWGWESRLADFDNDGVLEAIQATGFVKGQTNRWPELHELAMGNDNLVHKPVSWFDCRPGDGLSGDEHNPFYVRSRSGRYFDLAHEVGMGEPVVTRGIATADMDGDGDLDVAMGNQWTTSTVYRNDATKAGAFLGLRLLLPVGQDAAFVRFASRPGLAGRDVRGRPAIGAAATVHLPDGSRRVAQVDGGNGHSGARSPELHFGLGDVPDDLTLRVDLRWRDVNGQTQGKTEIGRAHV